MFIEKIEDGYLIRTYENGLVMKTLIGVGEEPAQPIKPSQPTNQEVIDNLEIVKQGMADIFIAIYETAGV